MSVDRIRTTHAGALPRSAELAAMIFARAAGAPVDEVLLEQTLRREVTDTVARQVACGLDSINDGELSKPDFTHYVSERVSGFAVREYHAGEGPPPLNIMARDKIKFADFFDAGFGGFSARVPAPRRYVCVAPLEYVGAEQARRDIDHFKAALAVHGGPAPYLPSVTLGTIEHWMTNEYYPTQEEFLYAIGDVMREEYQAIIDAGFLLQLDDPDLADGWQMYPEMTVAEYRKYATLRIEALNHALRGIPKDRIRFHVCWGSYHGPHEFDIPLTEIADVLFKVNAAEFSIEASNPRHEHEWQVFEDVKLPQGAALIPGVVGHATNFIEHPDLIAQRLVRYGRLVGRENLLAGTDCGIGTRTPTPSICWAKLDALVEGARRASKVLWG